MQSDIDTEIVEFLTMFSRDQLVHGLLCLSVGRVLDKMRGMRRNWREAALAVDLKHVVDWLEVSILHSEDWLSRLDSFGRPKKLMKFGDLAGIVAEANKAMLRRAMQTPVRRIEDGDEALEHDIGDGWYVVRLLTEKALDNESASMGHCVGHGTYDKAVLKGTVAIFSLRDRHNKPHVTIEYDVREDLVSQVRGKQNARPIAEYARRVRNFIKAKRFEAIYRPMEIGLVVDMMGRWHEMENLPRGLQVKGRLDLSGADITELPADMDVFGDLDISGSSIEALPDGLKVTGSLRAAGSSLRALRLDHGIGRDVDISGTAITALPEGLEVDGVLDISATRMTALPPALVVTGGLVARSSAITVMPATVTVGGGLDLSDSRIRWFEAKTLYVGGNLDMRRCTDVAFPEWLEVEGAIDITGTTLMSGLDAVTAVGSFRRAGSNFHPAGREVKVLPRTETRDHRRFR